MLVVVTINGSMTVANVNDLVVFTPMLSVTCAVNDLLPAEVGVPLRTPALLKVIPAGSEPLVFDQR